MLSSVLRAPIAGRISLPSAGKGQSLCRSPTKISSASLSATSRSLPSHTRFFSSRPTITSHALAQSSTRRFYASGAANKKSSTPSAPKTNPHWLALRAMIEKNDKFSKNEVRAALKFLKEQDTTTCAEVLKMLSSPLQNSSSAEALAKSVPSEGYRVSKMGPVVEESLARLVEVTFELKTLPSLFSRLAVVYPDWRADGWDNVIERFISNKKFDSEVMASILAALPREIFCDLKIETSAEKDMIVKYEKEWKKDAKVDKWRLGTEQSAAWPAAYFGKILGKFSKNSGRLDESVSVVAYLALEVWSKSTPLGSTHPYEALVSSLYFSAEILANIVQTMGGLKNPQIAEFMQAFNLKLLNHLKTNPHLVKEGFNTFEYLEWVSVAVAEVSRLRGHKFNDVFMIKKCLDAMLAKWGSDDVSLVSASISNRFSVSQFFSEAIDDLKTQKKV